ncbi:MAG: flagellar basal-body rod protein FlgF [Capsulimonas sp.]|jgi:flagellar basal-body rod protein FlgF|nr:flagellar basal-body rod protein FlgF [Capsulimonas sp.]
MLANEQAQDAIAHNLANVNTTGYKQDIPCFSAFQSMLLQKTSQDRGQVGSLGNGGSVYKLATDYTGGALQKTNSPLDVALSGDAFLEVQTPQGIRFTRDGSMTLNAQGELVLMKSGAQVLDSSNRPISIPQNAKNISIGLDGQITADGRSVATLGLAGISSQDNATKVGDNMVTVSSQVRPASSGSQVRQGFLETANVSIVGDMVSMIAVLRAYETDQKMLQTEDEATGKAVNEVARVQ